MTEVLILLGSNIDKERKLPAALARLSNHPDLVVMAVSPTYASPAIGRDGRPSAQPPFHNVGVRLRTELTATRLRSLLRDVEVELGRVRSADQFAARPIDLDIVFYGEAPIELEGSPIPDPDSLRLPHLVLPLAAVAPNWIVSARGETLGQIAGHLPATEMEIVPQ